MSKCTHPLELATFFRATVASLSKIGRGEKVGWWFHCRQRTATFLTAILGLKTLFLRRNVSTKFLKLTSFRAQFIKWKSERVIFARHASISLARKKHVRDWTFSATNFSPDKLYLRNNLMTFLYSYSRMGPCHRSDRANPYLGTMGTCWSKWSRHCTTRGLFPQRSFLRRPHLSLQGGPTDLTQEIEVFRMDGVWEMSY